ncbi:MAG: MarR family transcriptional regulator [Rhodospirillaceae bacterium]|nr:MarR family transcriptional regulator [Rhodospirillaceae bacterium]MBT6139909.1 MarR family transcriptional regulator [Rhodospirillaceae bacterium]
MPPTAQHLYAVILDVRLCFNLLRARADALHADLNVNASMRAVMENLVEDSEKTVPAIARSKGVSRQHIQVITNSLIKANLVKTRDNPEDKRTSLISLTDKGQTVFGEIQEREALTLRHLSETFSDADLEVTQKTLRKLSNVLRGDKNA